jgi:hypothetical protein
MIVAHQKLAAAKQPVLSKWRSHCKLSQLVVALRQELQLLNSKYHPTLLSVNQLANELPLL